MADLFPTTEDSLFRFANFHDIKELVAGTLPPFFQQPCLQTETIEKLLSELESPCESIIVEEHYIDRPFMDEYREFYGTSFKHYPNYCRRLHFFSLSRKELEKQLKVILRQIARADTSLKKYYEICKRFSDRAYLGFMVVKPLPNTRIGRTIIRHPKESSGTLIFPCTRVYTSHFLGLELTVCGLPFQQQDGGMSACASTATWASLTHFAEFEHFQVPSPAALTKFAATQITRFGRSIPQENGLTIDQLCKAIEAVNLSPYLIAFKKPETIKPLLYSAVKAGFAPILIIKNTKSQHAVSVGGMTLSAHVPYVNVSYEHFKLRDESDRLTSIFINDDRIGPYQTASIGKDDSLVIQTIKGEDKWEITHLLIPLHHKIRFSFVSLYQLSLRVAFAVGEYYSFNTALTTETWIMKSRNYRRHALFGHRHVNRETSIKLNSLFSFSRYIGVIRLSDASFGVIDIIVDTTNTNRHTNVLLVLGRQIKNNSGRKLVEELARVFGSNHLIDE